jgi:hypothetical protein
MSALRFCLGLAAFGIFIVSLALLRFEFDRWVARRASRRLHRSRP